MERSAQAEARERETRRKEKKKNEKKRKQTRLLIPVPCYGPRQLVPRAGARDVEAEDSGVAAEGADLF